MATKQKSHGHNTESALSTDERKQMSDATYGLNRFNAADFTRLAREYPVTWTVIRGPAPEGMSCPYQQRGYAVCKIQGYSDRVVVKQYRPGE